MDLTPLSINDAASEIEKILSGNEPALTPEADQQPEPETEATPSEGEQDTTEPETEESEPETDEEVIDEEDEPELEIKHNGEIKKLRKSEVIALAQKGFDYAHKTQLVAEEKKVAEEQRQKYEALQTEAEQARNKSVEQNELMQAFLQYQVPTEDVLMTVLQKEGTEAYLMAKAKGEQVQKAISVLKQQREDALNQQQSEFETKRKEVEAREREALHNAVPELSTPEVSTKLVSYLQEQGFTAEQISSEVDHRLFVMAHKARKFDEMMKASETRKPVATIPKVTKKGNFRPDPKAVQMDTQQKAMQTLKQTGKQQDAVQAILARL